MGRGGEEEELHGGVEWEGEPTTTENMQAPPKF